MVVEVFPILLVQVCAFACSCSLTLVAALAGMPMLAAASMAVAVRTFNPLNQRGGYSFYALFGSFKGFNLQSTFSM